MRNRSIRKMSAIILTAAMMLSAYTMTSAEEGSTEAAVQTEAPAPQTEEPAPQTEAPAPQTEAPAPQTEAPAPQTEAPAPQTEAPAPQSEAPAPQTEAPAPQTEAASQTEKQPETQSPDGQPQAPQTEMPQDETEQQTEKESEAERTEETKQEPQQEKIKTQFRFENSEVVIIAKVSEKAKLPERAQIHVEKLMPGNPKYEEAKKASMRDLGTAENAQYTFYDVEFRIDGKKAELPDEAAVIQIQFKNVQNTEEGDVSSALHIDQTSAGAVAKDVTAESRDGSIKSVDFKF